MTCITWPAAGDETKLHARCAVALTTCSNKTTTTAAAACTVQLERRSNYTGEDNDPSPRVEHPAYDASRLMATYDTTGDLACLLPSEREACMGEAAVIADSCDSYLSPAGRTDGPRLASQCNPAHGRNSCARVAGATACCHLPCNVMTANERPQTAPRYATFAPSRFIWRRKNSRMFSSNNFLFKMLLKVS